MTSRTFEPDTDPTGVDTGGVDVTIPVVRSWKLEPIDRLDIVHDAGGAGAIDWKLYEHSSKDEDDLIAEDSSVGPTVHVEAPEGGWDWNPEKDGGDLTLEITPDSGTGNDFDPRVIISRNE